MQKKSKVIDCFLFFQEKEILELRLRYLDALVDYFVIVESSQTFSGKKKEFNYEKIQDNFVKYKNKIIYYKLDLFISSYDELILYLKEQKDLVSQKILVNMQLHNHYDKNLLHWVIDTFHRECISYPLENLYLNNDDIVMLSDIDEIPSHEFINSYIIRRPNFAFNKQYEFSFYLNLLSNSQWVGTIISTWDKMCKISFTNLRLDSKKNQKFVTNMNLSHGGYHFTSYGNIEMIKNKIKNWGHQEFNNPIVFFFLKKNLEFGMDIFGRSFKKSYQIINLADRLYFDQSISKIIISQKMYILKNYQSHFPFYYLIFYILGKIWKLIYKIYTKIISKKRSKI